MNMAVNLKAAEGRILLLRGRSTEVFPWYLKGGVITRLSGKRAYFVNESGKETFTHEFSAVVDTAEEEGQLLEFTKQVKTELYALLENFAERSEALEEELNARPQKMKSISSRVRRTRA
jgi:hypothetical protein